MDLPRIARKYARITIVAKKADGSPANVVGLDAALVPPHDRPDAATSWRATSYAAGVGLVLIAGPDADPTGALVVPSTGADLWVRVTDSPEVDATFVDRIKID